MVGRCSDAQPHPQPIAYTAFARRRAACSAYRPPARAPRALAPARVRRCTAVMPPLCRRLCRRDKRSIAREGPVRLAAASACNIVCTQPRRLATTAVTAAARACTTRKHVCARARAPTHTNRHTDMPTPARHQSHTCVRTIQTCTHTHAHAHKAHKHTNTDSNKRTHTRARGCACVCVWCM